jgi:hypothetical protein
MVLKRSQMSFVSLIGGKVRNIYKKMSKGYSIALWGEKCLEKTK